MAPWRGFVRVQSALMRELDLALEASEGLSLWGYKALRELDRSEGCCLRMTDLARAIQYSPSGLTRLIERLERAGLVERQPCPENGRGSVAALTRAGRARFRRAQRVHRRQVHARFLDRFSEEELSQLVELWERLLPDSTA